MTVCPAVYSEAIADIHTGFWSDGKRLRDSVQMGAEGLSGSLKCQSRTY